MKFISVFTGWEGSAAAYRILRDAISRSNRLKFPKGELYIYILRIPSHTFKVIVRKF